MCTGFSLGLRSLDGFRGLCCFRHYEAASRGVEVEQLGITAPVDGRFQLPLRLLFAELLVEHIQKELLRNGVIALVAERTRDLSQQQDVLDGRLTENFL